MIEGASRQGASWTREQDRLATDLRHATRHHDWDPPREVMATIVEWHMGAVAAARADVWIPGTAGCSDPLVEEVLNRFYAHHLGATITRLTEENTDLKRQLLQALACIRFYTTAGADGGAQAKAALESLLALGLQAADAEVIPMFNAAEPHKAR